MADGGASTIIMLVTALLISSAASAVLVQEWSSTTRLIQQQQQGMQLSGEIGIDFAGDPMMVSLSTTANTNEITFYIQNTGIHTMDEKSLAIIVDGVPIDDDDFDIDIDTDFFPGTSTSCDPNILLEVTVSAALFNTFSDNSEISIYATARSDGSSGPSMSTSMNEEVKLHEL